MISIRCNCQYCKLRGIASGVIYPRGRNAARDEAQVRILRRALGSEVAA